jgi:putative ABC transport system substrate-binding protein
MRRRDFMTVLAGATAYPLFAGAQQKAMPVIGFLGMFPPSMSAQIELEQAAFRQGLSETGYVEGQNVAIEYRQAEGHYDLGVRKDKAELEGDRLAPIPRERVRSSTLSRPCPRVFTYQ